MQRNRMGVGTAVAGVVIVAAALAMVGAAGGCANKSDKDAAAAGRRGKIPMDRSVTAGLAKMPPPATRTGRSAPGMFPAYSTPYPVAGAVNPVMAPQFQPVDPTDSALPAPVYAAASPVTAGGNLGGGGAVGGGARYMVQKGDTLFGIARNRYGSGGQWQRIAAANPGLSPETLKAGTAIVVP